MKDIKTDWATYNPLLQNFYLVLRTLNEGFYSPPVLVHSMHIIHINTHRRVGFQASRSCRDCKDTNPRLTPIPILLQGLQHLI